MKWMHLSSIIVLVVVLVGGFWLGKNKPALLGGYI